jgi:hypothetical protein
MKVIKGREPVLKGDFGNLGLWREKANRLAPKQKSLIVISPEPCLDLTEGHRLSVDVENMS